MNLNMFQLECSNGLDCCASLSYAFTPNQKMDIYDEEKMLEPNRSIVDNYSFTRAVELSQLKLD